MFKGHCFPKSIIIQTVYFKFRFGLSYREIEELMPIRGVKVDHAIIQRWVFKFTPLLEKEFRKRKKAIENNGKPELINIDKSGSNKHAIRIYNKRSFSKIQIRQCKYLNNIVEQDHRFVKKRIMKSLGFKEFESAKRTISGIEIVHMIRKDQLISNKKSMFRSFYALAS